MPPWSQLYIYIQCFNCKGAGTVKPFHAGSPPSKCSNCQGRGKYLWGEIKDELIPEP